ncbi:MAG: glutamate-5-semialdehyde dehydrogenase [Planctomycetota bacterium]|nr:MAG: glutamate-5-semialdehyde dehydrogenase [Planctomycetota bacterium]
MTDLEQYCQTVGRQAREASRLLATAGGDLKNGWLRLAAQLIRDRIDDLVSGNVRDLEQAPEYGLAEAAVDRLRLTPDRIEGIAAALEQVAALPDPVGEVIDGHVRPNGLSIIRRRVPLGVVFFIYESRPNVTADAAALCVKSGNAVILRGGKEALHSNLALYRVLADALQQAGLPENAVQLVETTDRAAVGHFLGLSEWIDVAIPRGGRSLIERVASEAAMPVIKHFDGVCHVYVDESADLEMARSIVLNAKCQRPGVCNAAECLLVHAGIADQFLPIIGPAFDEAGVEVRGDDRVCRALPAAKRATDEDFRTEYLALTISAKVVDSLEDAVTHINTYGSHHTDAIITSDVSAADRFVGGVDSAAVMVNASTRFNDGGEFGLGAEIGISTDKFHARGPCGLRELTSYKYVVQGQGQVR